MTCPICHPCPREAMPDGLTEFEYGVWSFLAHAVSFGMLGSDECCDRHRDQFREIMQTLSDASKITDQASN